MVIAVASYADLMTAYGSNATSAIAHYINFGYSEGRSADAFNEFSYTASRVIYLRYTELIMAMLLQNIM